MESHLQGLSENNYEQWASIENIPPLPNDLVVQTLNSSEWLNLWMCMQSLYAVREVEERNVNDFKGSKGVYV